MSGRISASGRLRVLQQQRPEGCGFGRPPKPLPQNFHQMHKAWRTGVISLHEAALACGLPDFAFYNKVIRAEKLG